MASYGSFETNREIASGQGSVVYSAHKTGESANTYAVKVFSLQPYVEGDQESRADLGTLLAELTSSFTDRVSLQKKAAESSKNVAPIFEFGTEGESAWYVTRLYPRSIHKIIEGKVALSYEGLFGIVESVLTGAQDFKRTCGRSHGNLKPTNILISGGAKIKDSEVVISDPLPGGRLEIERYELADLRSIGEIIYQLVRQRELTDASDWLILPIESSAEWTRLFGKHTAAWLELCNRLLDPNLSSQSYNLEKLRADLEPLRPKPPVSGRQMAVIAAAVVLAGVAAFFALNRPTRILIESSPPGAVIFGTGQLNPPKTTAGKTGIKLAPGQHTLTAHVEGLSDVVTNFTLEKRESKTIHFNFEYGTVHLESQPAKASILVDGKELGKTPMTIYQKPGSVVYKLDLGKNFENATVTANPKANEEVKFNPVLKALTVSAEDAVVEFSSDPDGAKLYLNGKESDEMPARKLVPVGTNQITAKYRDWPPVTATLVLAPGQKTAYNFNFDYGRVALRSEPSGATVWVGTNRFGPTPVEMLSTTGAVAFRFERAGYEITNVTTSIAKSGKLTILNPKLITTNAILEITSDPAPALITVSRDQHPTLTLGYSTPNGVLVTNLEPGNYTVTAHYGDLEDKVMTQQALKGVSTPFKIVFDYGTVQLDSQPAGAGITLGGTNIGVAPRRLIQRPGTSYVYKFDLADYESMQKDVSVAAKGSSSFTARLLPANVGVSLTSDPPSATISDEKGNNLGAVEKIDKLRWGDHVLTAQYPGLDPVTEVLSVKKAGTPPHTFQFTYGTASITSAPPGAIIRDHATGKQLGVTPLNLNLKPGGVNYDLVLDDKVSNIVAVIRSGITPMGIAFSGKSYVSVIGLPLVWVENLPGTKDGGYVGKYEVTQAEYEKVMGANPSQFTGEGRRPVENVTWSNAKEFCQKLTQQDKAKMPAGSHYELPSEAQWSFFAVGATAEGAVVKKLNPTDTTASVGTGRPNKYGLYDIVGNVWEWCDSPDADKPMRGWAFNSTGGFSKPFDLARSEKHDASIHKGQDLGFRVILVQ
jgi:hypothetical protein